MTVGRKGEHLAPLAELALQAGVVAFSDDGDPVFDAELMRRALEYSAMYQQTDHPARAGPVADARAG